MIFRESFFIQLNSFLYWYHFMKRFFKIILWTFLILFILINFISATNAYKFTHFYNSGEVVIKPENKKTTWDHVSDILFGKDYIKKKNVPLPAILFLMLHLLPKTT